MNHYPHLYYVALWVFIVRRILCIEYDVPIDLKIILTLSQSVLFILFCHSKWR